MIKIKNKTMAIEGKIDEINDDVITFIETFMNNKSIIKRSIGENYDNISDYFSTDTLIRYLFTICSVDEDEFHKFLKSIEKIIDEIDSGKFVLIYKE